MGSISAGLKEQLEYYRARAGEYDEWWLRQGRYDQGAELNREWFKEAAQVVSALEEFKPAGQILELACGTGLWSERLYPYASTLTLIDGSREMLDEARSRLNSTSVEFLQADIFEWQPEGEFDLVFFSFWLSHVPPAKFDPFWELVRHCLAPGGRVFFIDSLLEKSSTALDHKLPEPSATTMGRRLNDGREFQIYKIHYDPSELERKLETLGWQIEVAETHRYFLYGHGKYIG